MKYELCNAVQLVGGPQDGEQMFFTSENAPLSLTYRPLEDQRDGVERFHQYDLGADGLSFRYCGVMEFTEGVDYE